MIAYHLPAQVRHAEEIEVGFSGNESKMGNGGTEPCRISGALHGRAGATCNTSLLCARSLTVAFHTVRRTQLRFSDLGGPSARALLRQKPDDPYSSI